MKVRDRVNLTVTVLNWLQKQNKTNQHLACLFSSMKHQSGLNPAISNLLTFPKLPILAFSFSLSLSHSGIHVALSKWNLTSTFELTIKTNGKQEEINYHTATHLNVPIIMQQVGKDILISVNAFKEISENWPGIQ